MRKQEQYFSTSIHSIDGKPFVCIYAPDCTRFSAHRWQVIDLVMKQIDSYNLGLSVPVPISLKNDVEHNDACIQLKTINARAIFPQHISIPKEVWDRCNTGQQDAIIETMRKFYTEVAVPHHEMRSKIKTFLEACTACPFLSATPKYVVGEKHKRESRVDFSYTLPFDETRNASNATGMFVALEAEIENIAQSANQRASLQTHRFKSTDLEGGAFMSFTVSFTQGTLDVILSNPELNERLTYAATHPKNPKFALKNVTEGGSIVSHIGHIGRTATANVPSKGVDKGSK